MLSDWKAEAVIVYDGLEAVLLAAYVLLTVKPRQANSQPGRDSSWFGFRHLLLLCGQSRLRWKPPVISHRMLSCCSSSESCTASHCCNLQINIYGSACSGGLSGSGPSGTIEERAWLCNSTTLPVCPGQSLAGRGKQKCAWLCHTANKIEMHCALCLWKLPAQCLDFSLGEIQTLYSKLGNMSYLKGVTWQSLSVIRIDLLCNSAQVILK